MNIQNLIQWLKVFLFASLAFLAISSGIFFLQSASSVRETSKSLQKTSLDTQQLLVHLETTVKKLDTTIVLAGGLLNTSRDLLRDEQQSIKAANTQTISTMSNLNQLVKNADSNQKQVVDSINTTLLSVQSTTSSVIPVMKQTQKDLQMLEPVITQMTPLMKNTSDTMEHVSGITADTQTEIHKFVFPPPQPWYRKYIINPAKLAARMVTIPLK